MQGVRRVGMRRTASVFLACSCILLWASFDAGMGATAEEAPPPPAQTAAATPPPAPAANDSKPLSPEELEQLVAPIAVYPDPLLANVLMASTYPLEVVE